MTDISGYLFDYGQPLVFLVPLLSCLALPVPASAIFMLAGTLAAAGDFDFLSLWLTGFAGAMAGDQIGYLASRHFSSRIQLLARRNNAMQSGLERARKFSDKWGGLSVFFSRWLASPLGPYVNVTSGLTRYDWHKFLAWGAAGEAVWVTLYLGIGYAFSAQAQAIADMIGNAVWLIIAAGVTILLGRKVFSSSTKAPG
ncbi:MAG: DedA family protein [Nitratireductor sp.]|nr:DedA family protein [Nitratireductor sp.]